MREREKIVLWPIYFDLDYSSLQGRRVPKQLSLRDIKADEIYRASLDLGVKGELKVGAAHPSHPWERKGAVIVEKSGSKTKQLLKIARRIRENRESKQI